MEVFIPQGRKAGISFVIRVRDEERFLGLALKSLKLIMVPHEIIVVCHMCKDGSKPVAEAALAEGQPVRIYEYGHPLSRAGYETLITPTGHPASLAYFYNWCFNKASYNWIFKWDADFVASPELITFLNKDLVLNETTRVRYNIPCEMTPDVVNSEHYLYNCILGFKKYIFWETPVFYGNSELRDIPHKIHTVPHTLLKDYWKLPPWFVGGVEPRLEELHKKVVGLCGPEAPGASRAQCKDCEVPFFSVKAHESILKVWGIELIA